MSRSPWILVSLSLSACQMDGDGGGSITDNPIDEQDFPAEWADAWCARAYECDQGEFESNWSDHDDCVAEKSDDAEFATDWSDLICGDYDENAASDCVDAVDSETCEGWSEDDWKTSCDNVYGC